MNRAQLEQASRAQATWYPIGNDRLVARVLGNLKLVVDRRDMSLSPHLVMDGFWESWVSCWAMRQCHPTDRLINIGANCGYYTMLFARAMQKVVAVEPQAFLAECIALSASLNGFDSKVDVKQVVAGSESRTVQLQLHQRLTGSAFVGDAEGDGWVGATGAAEVPAHELLPDATCAFIDAEGYEPQIWRGLKPLLDKQQLRWVALEWSPSRYENAERFLMELSDYGTLRVVDDRSEEVPVSADALLKGVGWDTLVVRRK